VLKFKQLVLATYPGTGTLGIVAACGTDGTVSEHYEGRAWDWQVSAANPTQKAEADAFLTWLTATDKYGNKYAMARRLGVMYVIWNARIWGIYRASEGWRSYSCSGTTGCHKDHVHFSFSWAGALAKTSYWSGTPVTGTVPGPKPPTTAPKPPAPAPAPAPKPPAPRPGPVPTPPSDGPVAVGPGRGPADPPARGERGDRDDHPSHGRHHGHGHGHGHGRGHRQPLTNSSTWSRSSGT
jgi:hypothetical protein